MVSVDVTILRRLFVKAVCPSPIGRIPLVWNGKNVKADRDYSESSSPPALGLDGKLSSGDLMIATESAP